MKKFVLSALLATFVVAIVVAGCMVNYFNSSLALQANLSNSGVIAVKEECYFVCLNKSQSKLEAETIAGDCLDGKSAGYVFYQNGYFYVVHSAYEKQNDAHLVSEHLKKSRIESEILCLSFPKIAIEEEFSQDSHNVLQEAMNSFFASFRSLSDLSTGLSTKVYSESEVGERLQKLSAKVAALQKKFDSAFETGSPKLISIGQYLADEVECLMLTEAVERDINARAIELVEIYKNMCEELA